MLYVMFGKLVLYGMCVTFGTLAQSIPKTSFSCDGRTSGYYADVSTGCQVYHMCDGLGRQFSYKCPSKTLFQQRMLICDHWYMVNCSKAEEDYSANLLIGQQGRAFIEELEYRRTPRPDLVDPNNADFNTYRVEQDETHSAGDVLDPKSSNHEKREESDTQVPEYVKQVYYRTSYNTANRGLKPAATPKGEGNSVDTNPKLVITKGNVNRGEDSFKSQEQENNIPVKNNENVQTRENSLSRQVNFPSNFKATTPVYPKHVDVDLSKFTDFGNPLELESESKVPVNFPSKYEATTPVYPKHVDSDPSRISEFDIPIEQNPVEPIFVNFPSKFKATTPVYPQQVDVDLSKFSGSEELPPEQNPQDKVVNFASNFKATTPVYPKEVNIDMTKFLEPVELPLEGNKKSDSVNFASNFNATTPVYPQSVEATSPIPDEAGLLPPLSASESQKDVKETENKVQVNFASNFQATTPNYPTSVEPTSPDPNEVGLVLPQLTANQQNPEIPSFDIEPPNFEKTFSRRSDEYDPSVVGNTFNSKQLTEFMVTMKPEQLKNLKALWHIPDYDFPLDTASGASYGSDFSSFQAKAVSKR